MWILDKASREKALGVYGQDSQIFDRVIEDICSSLEKVRDVGK
jgi:hypothetical protein